MTENSKIFCALRTKAISRVSLAFIPYSFEGYVVKFANVSGDWVLFNLNFFVF